MNIKKRSYKKVAFAVAIFSLAIELCLYFSISHREQSNNNIIANEKKDTIVKQNKRTSISDTASQNRPLQKPDASETPKFDLILTFLSNVSYEIHNQSNEEMSKTNSIDLKDHGFTYKGWIHDAENLADQYGSYVYCKNCGVNNIGNPTGMKSKSYMIKFGPYGFGPCVCFYTIDRELYNNLYQQFINEGYSKDSTEKDGKQLVKHGDTEDTFITFDRTLKILSVLIWRSPRYI